MDFFSESIMNSSESECHYNSEANAVFPSKEYLKRFVDPTADPMKVHSKFLEAWHTFYDRYSNGSNGSRALLEFGGGPTIHSLISAAQHVETITFADYAESNRDEIIMWKDGANGGAFPCEIARCLHLYLGGWMSSNVRAIFL